MKIFIHRTLLEKLLVAQTGAQLFGSACRAQGVCNITAIETSAPSFLGAALIGLKGGEEERKIARCLKLPLFVDTKNNNIEAESGKSDIIQYDDNDAFKRNPLTAEQLKHVRTKRVLIVGLGSGGVAHALHLVCSGVEQITVCDFDVLKPHNVLRDRRDFRYVGLNKAFATELFCRNWVSNATINTITKDLTLIKRSKELLETVREHDLVIGATDSYPAQLKLQAASILEKRLFVSVGCHQEARSGEVFFHSPNHSRACLYCAEGPPEHTTPQAHEYGLPDEDRAAMPALGAAIEHVASLASGLCVALLLMDHSEPSPLSLDLHRRIHVDGAQLLAIGGPLPNKDSTHGGAAPIIGFKRAFHTRWCKVKNDPDCELCKDPQSYLDPR